MPACKSFGPLSPARQHAVAVRLLSVRRYWLLLLALLLCLQPGVFLPSLANAHEARPAVADLALSGRNLTLSLRIDAEALLAGTTEDHETDAIYQELRALPAEELRERIEAFVPDWLSTLDVVTVRDVRLPLTLQTLSVGDTGDIRLARDTQLVLITTVPQGHNGIRWRWAEQNGPVIVRAGERDSPDAYSELLQGGEQSAPLFSDSGESASLLSTVWRYVQQGVLHIVPLGLDHILFVVGLFLLAPFGRPIIWQVTSFTVAHSVTLLLAALGAVRVDPGIVEPLIALSIAAVALENVFTTRLHPWRPLIVFAFGLLHGLGFASVFGDLGLGSGSFIAALLSFNIGVELGQLGVVLLCFILIGWPLRSRHWYRERVSIPLSLAIAAVGIYWFLERLSN